MPTSQPQENQTSVRNWQSVRTVLEGLILAGVCWLAYSTNKMSEQVAVAIERQTTTKEDITYIKAKLETVPDIARTVAESKIRLDEHDRRILQLETEQRHK